MSGGHFFPIGAKVRVHHWGGLRGVDLVVAEHKRDDFYALDFAHNGNRVPGYYQETMLGSAA